MPVYTTTFCIRIFYWCGGIVAIAGATCVHLWSTTCSLLFYHVADSLELTLQDYFNTFYILTLFWTSYMRLHALLKKKVHSKRVELPMWTSFVKTGILRCQLHPGTTHGYDHYHIVSNPCITNLELHVIYFCLLLLCPFSPFSYNTHSVMWSAMANQVFFSVRISFK